MKKIIIPILVAAFLAACAAAPPGAPGGYQPMTNHPMDHWPNMDGP